jgi:predicted Rossmann fold flavoprotein
LDVSHVIARACDEGRRDAQLLVRWKPYNEDDWTSMFNRDGSSTVMALLHRELPDRLAAALCVHADVPAERKFAQLRRDERRRLLDVLCQCALPWNGHEGYRKAEVTGGGVGLEAVHPKTMESRAHPGLHFCGEVLDVFGPIGGYNFYWAWATGRAAGLGAAMKRD